MPGQFFQDLLIFGCAVSSLLCVGFSSCRKQGLLFIAVLRLLIEVASPVAGYGLEVRGLQQLRLQPLEQGLSSVALGLSCSTTCGIFQDMGIPRHRNQTYVPCIGRQILNFWDHQGSPRLLLKFQFLEHTSVPSLLIHNSEFKFCFLVISFYYRIVVQLIK